MDTPEVRPGQVWADNDPRSKGRTLRVEEVDDVRATCTVLTNSDQIQALVDEGSAWPSDTRGTKTRIKLRRFQPTSTGYRLVSEPQVYARSTPVGFNDGFRVRDKNFDYWQYNEMTDVWVRDTVAREPEGFDYYSWHRLVANFGPLGERFGTVWVEIKIKGAKP